MRAIDKSLDFLESMSCIDSRQLDIAKSRMTGALANAGINHDASSDSGGYGKPSGGASIGNVGGGRKSDGDANRAAATIDMATKKAANIHKDLQKTLAKAQQHTKAQGKGQHQTWNPPVTNPGTGGGKGTKGGKDLQPRGRGGGKRKETYGNGY